MDFHNEFKKEVIDYFSSEYLKGRTPNPCVLCNEKIKFGIFIKKAAELDAPYVATGHYACVDYEKRRKRFILREGADKRKDQSYFLFGLTQDALSKIIFPLCGLKKDAVRRKAAAMGLAIHNKAESQEICFVQDDYTDYLAKVYRDKIKPGPVIDINGHELGTHKGIPFYTIGQREGLNIAYKHALYVIKIDKEKNTIIVGTKENRFFREVVVKNLNWIVPPAKERLRVKVKIRSQQKKADAALYIKGEAAHLSFDKPQESPTPGQAAVFYEKDIVLGGGWIDSASR
jgi:tRNA-specific 2-thiouridylase